MECYEGATMIKSFRGLIASGTQDIIVLHTNDGSMGYRIKRLNIIGQEPGEETVELVLKIYKVSQTTFDNAVDFSDQTLLGVAYLIDSSSTSTTTADIIFFDQEIFNQDIYVTAVDTSGSGRAANYYMELEQVKLDLSESTVATLKDIRNITTPA